MKTAPILVTGGLIAIVAAQGEPTVETSIGTFRGAVCPLSKVNAFTSIRFATPPVGDLRLAPPQPLNETSKVNDIVDATKPAPTCIQFSTSFGETTDQTEDCLFLNVWVPPAAKPDSKLPVRVWLYGGSNTAGGISNPLYDGCASSVNTIQVSINYRVGPLGFLAAKDLGLNGNYGLQDQLLGLRWVHDHIAAFGGDPARVVLFGQSAGATDAWLLSTLPQAEGLFSSAILQSCVPAILPTLEAASKSSESFLTAVGCADAACLRTASVDAIRDAQKGTAPETELLATNDTDAIYPRSAMLPGLGLVLDGTVVKAQPLSVGPRVPTIVGTNTNEASLFILTGLKQAAFNLKDAAYHAFLAAAFPNTTVRDEVRRRYPLSRFGGSSAVPAAANAIAAVGTDQRFRCPARRVLVSAVRGGTKAWTYSFAQRPTCSFDQRVPGAAAVLELLGATHGAELPYVFAEVDGLPRPSGNCSLSREGREISAKFVGAWDSMADRAEPGGGWPEWDAAGSMGVNIGNGTWETAKVDYSVCDFWDTLDVDAGAGSQPGVIATRTDTSATAPPSAATGRPGAGVTEVTVVGVVWLASLLVL